MASLNIDVDVEVFEQLQHASAGYQSLTDVPQALTYCEETADFQHMENKSTGEIIHTLKSVSALQGQMQLLAILLRREGRYFDVEGKCIEDRLCAVLKSASVLRYWAVVRECTALLCKEVESISPYITTILVSGKQLSVGTGSNERTLEKPILPAEVQKLFYQPNSPIADVVESVLHQELVLYCGKLIGPSPEFFKGIMNIRIGNLLRSMEFYLHDILDLSKTVKELAPNEVRKLVVRMLSLDEWARDEKLTMREIRVIEGCLGKTPDDFYEKIWKILEKTPLGLRIGDHVLLQQPTISEMSRSELNFAYCVQGLLSHIESPEYRQIVVELLSVMATILVRNPELSFIHEVNLDRMVQEAFKLFLKDQKLAPTNDLTTFYNAQPTATTSYLARSVVNFVLTGDLSDDVASGECRLS